MQVYNALDIKKGKGKKKMKKAHNSFTQPLQFLSMDEKDSDWANHNLDWLEWQGVKQISENAKRLMKNYNLAKGTIDRADYFPEEPNDMTEIMDILSQDSIQNEQDDSAMELKFYPIIPNVVDVLCAEFAKRNTKVDYRAIDEYSYNEILEAKTSAIAEALLEDAQAQLTQRMVQMGMDPNSPEAQKQFDPEALSKLPEIEEFYSKDYQTLGEIWATKQHAVDVNRFDMDELEEIAFRDMLITDREFWHFKMMEDDYKVELWNPVLTFYHKSPDVRYISQGSWVGKIDMLTVSDVIDFYGSILKQDQLEALETLHPLRSGRYLLNGIQNEGYYNPGVDHNEQLETSVGMKQHLSFNNNSYNPDDIVSWIIGQSEHTGKLHDEQMLRVTTGYWKTQRKIGYLTAVNEGGEVDVDIVDESYVVSNNPIYNTQFDNDRNPETLVFGDHVEWIWINQTIGGVKIGPNRMQQSLNREEDDFSPIYIGIQQNEIGPLRFQFKGEDSLYGCKLPVEGRIFTERNTKSSSLVDLMKPSQIAYNMVNNQAVDILIDEIGTVVALDQNSLPKHSLGEDWGKGNYAKAYVAMKDFSVLPLDTSITNTENSLNMAHLQTLNLEQTNRLRTRMEMSNFFKQQALEVIGFTPQRLGQQIGQTDTAKGVEQAVTGSYAQTEKYFINHSDHLMPKVHSMRTDCAQYYHSKKSSVRMQSMITPGERKFFEINGTDLLMIDLNVFCKVNANHRAILEQMKQIAASNNTGGQTLYDMAEVLEADSIATLNKSLQEIDKKAEERASAQREHEQKAQESEIAAREKEKQMTLDHEAKENEKDRRAKVLVAEIQASGYGAQQDIDQNLQSDFKDSMDSIKSSEEYAETMDQKRSEQADKRKHNEKKIDIEQQKVDIARDAAGIPLQVARENTSSSEIAAKKENRNNNKGNNKKR